MPSELALRELASEDVRNGATMRIEEAIVEWGQTRPAWQRAVLRRSAQGEQLGENDFAAIVGTLLDGGWSPDEQFGVEHMRRAGALDLPVALRAIKNVSHVNALAGAQALEFCPNGLTVVYGDNGSGKSGYARLIKQMVRARHQQPVLSDVFVDDPASIEQRAEVVVAVGESERSIRWPDQTCPELAQVTFYDEACGDAFITEESDVTYKPAALAVVDALIAACDGVRAEIDRRLKSNEQDKPRLPTPAAGTSAAQLVDSLATTSDEVIEAACALPDGIDAKIDEARREELRLCGADLGQEKLRLRENAKALRKINERVSECVAVLGAEAAKALEALKNERTAKEDATSLASAETFQAEPVAGVGGAAWRAMWDAARKYSAEDAYPAQPFPATSDGALCVFCHQPILAEASSRLSRFETFAQNETQRQLVDANARWSAAVKRVSEFCAVPTDVATALERLTKEHPDLGAECRRVLEGFAARKTQLDGACAAASPWPSDPAPVLAVELEAKAEQADRQADAMDDAGFKTRLSEASGARAELEATKQLHENRDVLLAEAARLRTRAHLEALKKQTATTGVSAKAAELTRKHTTKIVRDWFTREADRLRLTKVALEDRGAPKGAVQHRPALVGAVQDAHVQQVLSEGEQTALGLAGFFTDVYLDISKSAIVLDDPVTSLDHGRRENVAVRLAELASERQVIVFTHDVAFVVDLRAAASRQEVAFTERSVERLGTGLPGACRTKHPWKAKDVGQRFGDLEQALARIRKSSSEWDQETYERESAEWAGKLSETWERQISQEVVGQVIDRASLEVRPRMFRVLAKITDRDDSEFQTSYARVSRWARRHDKSPELNYVPPTVEDMATELALVTAWHKRVKGYQSQK